MFDEQKSEAEEENYKDLKYFVTLSDDLKTNEDGYLLPENDENCRKELPSTNKSASISFVERSASKKIEAPFGEMPSPNKLVRRAQLTDKIEKRGCCFSCNCF